MFIVADVSQREEGLTWRESDWVNIQQFRRSILCNSEVVAILVFLYQRAIGSLEDAMQCSSHSR